MYQCNSHLLTIIPYGQTLDESHENVEEHNEIEWKSIKRMFSSLRWNPESFKMIGLKLEIS